MSKTFKDYYKDPEFKKRHQEYMIEKVTCICKVKVARCNMTKHRETKKHQQWIKNHIDKDKIEDYFKKINSIKKKMDKLKNEVDDIYKKLKNIK